MSFEYRGGRVTLSNMGEVFKGVSTEILDEVRLAILDDTPIGGVLAWCMRDKRGLRLAEYRKAIRDGLPAEWLHKDFTVDSIYYLRDCFSKGLCIDCVSKYITKGVMSLPAESIELLLKTLSITGNFEIMDKVDFRLVKESVLPLILEGVEKGYPIYLFGESSYLTPEVLKLIYKGIDMGFDILPFTKGKWSADVVGLLLAGLTVEQFTDVIPYLTVHFTAKQVQLIILALVDGADYRVLCKTLENTEGYPAFSLEQMTCLFECLCNRIDVEPILNAQISAKDMRLYIEEFLV